MPDLSTTYLGLQLKNPIVASASPLSKKIGYIKRLESAGAAAIVMYSLFEEQIVHESLELDHYLSRHVHSFAEALTYLPDMESYNRDPDTYLAHLTEVKRAVDIPVIGSLNGISTGGWIKYARMIQEAGADALELNIYYLPTDLQLSGSELEGMYIKLVRDVRASITIPLAIKVSPFFSSIPHMAQRFVEAGADGLVFFNRFYQPDFDIESLDVMPRIHLSTSHDLLLPLRWIAILSGRLPVDFALTGGVHTSQDVLKAMMAGAKVAMMASELIENGVERVSDILNGMLFWMEEHEYESIRQMQGSMNQQAVAEPAAFERANYMKALNSFDPYLL